MLLLYGTAQKVGLVKTRQTGVADVATELDSDGLISHCITNHPAVVKVSVLAVLPVS